MYLADMGYTAILDWLEQHGYRTAKGNKFSKGSEGLHIRFTIQNNKSNKTDMVFCNIRKITVID